MPIRHFMKKIKKNYTLFILHAFDLYELHE